MECAHCHKKADAVLEFYSEIPGAVIVARETGSKYAYVWPATFGLNKQKGCVEFGSPENGNCCQDLLIDKHLATKWCEETMREFLYFDFPPEETAWLVTPTKDGCYWWKRIDTKIDFTNE